MAFPRSCLSLGNESGTYPRLRSVSNIEASLSALSVLSEAGGLGVGNWRDGRDGVGNINLLLEGESVSIPRRTGEPILNPTMTDSSCSGNKSSFGQHTWMYSKN